MIRQGVFRAEKVEYPDGVGCCLWRIFPDGDEDTGICWDFAFDELNDVTALLDKLKVAPVEQFETSGQEAG